MAIDLKEAKKFLENDYKRRESLGLTSEGDGNKYFSIKKDGQFYIRVLALDTFMVGAHWGVLEGKEGRAGKALRCPKAFDNSPCPVCQAVLQLSKSDDPYDIKQAEAWQVRIKYPMLVIDLEEESEEFVPRLYEAPKTIWQAVLEWCSNPQWGDITSLENGRNAMITREKAKAAKMYTFQPDPEMTSIDIDPSKLPVLKEAFKPESFEDIQYALANGMFPPKAKEDDKQKVKRNFSVATPVAAKKPTPYSKGLPAPKVQDEEPEVEETQEEEVQQPAARAIRKEAAPRAQVTKVAPKVAASVQSIVDDAEPEDEVEEEQPAASVKTTNQSLRDRLQAAKMAAPATRR